MNNTYRIHPIVMGSKVFDKSMMTYQYGQGQTYTIPIYCWYIEGDGPKILVDTGEMHPIQSPEREAAIGGKIWQFEDGLARWGLTPDDIDVVIHTHLHNDHCENDYKCSHARFYVHQKELEVIHHPHPLDYRYLEDYILDVEENGQIQIITEDMEILPGISVINTPAHTLGGLSVVIQTSAGRAIITGFCGIMEHFEPPAAIKAMEMDVIPPGTHVNVQQAYDQVLRIREMADILLPLPEPRFAGCDTIP